MLSRLHPETMYNVILWATKVIMQKSLFISMSCDEVTTIDNQSWLFVHVYVTNEWKRVSILLNLQRVVDGAIFNNLTSVIMKSLMEFGGLSETNLANKLVSFGVERVIVFQGVKNGVKAQIMQKHAPFVSGVHCMALTNLVIQTLSDLILVSKIESLLASMYNYFVHSLKHHLEITKLA